MAAKPLTTEAIALTEKKMDMTLDDIIRMSKNKKTTKQRVPNKSQKSSNNFIQDKSSKLRRYMDSRSSLRQGALAKRRSNFQANQFPVAAETAQKAVNAPLRNNRNSYRNRVASWNKARFPVSANQTRVVSGGFPAKQSVPSPQPLQEKMDGTPKQRPQTLDSLFANMTEQRMRLMSRKNNAVQRNGGRNRRPPLGRGQFGN